MIHRIIQCKSDVYQTDMMFEQSLFNYSNKMSKCIHLYLSSSSTYCMYNVYTIYMHSQPVISICMKVFSCYFPSSCPIFEIETRIYTLTDSRDMKMSPYISLPVLRGCVHVCASVIDKSLPSPYSDPLSAVCKLCLTVTQKTDCLKPEMDYTKDRELIVSLSLFLSLPCSMFLDVDIPGMILN